MPCVGRRDSADEQGVADPSLWDRRDFFSQVEQLLDLESTAVLSQEAGVTTVTFFRGISAAAAVELLRARLRALLAANPWVAGRVVRVKGEPRLQVRYPEGEAAAGDAALMDELLRVDPPGLRVHASMAYEDLASAVLGSTAAVERLGARFMKELPDVLFGSEVWRDALQTRVTLVSDPADPEAFALVFSMGHTTVDGSAYYHVLNMLSEDSEIRPLQVARKHEASPKMVEAQGKGDYSFMLSTLITKAAADLARGPRTRAVCLQVDEARMRAAKEAAVAQGVEGVSFVSSNDVLVSALARMAKARVYSMAMNFRGRVEGLELEDVGNYESALMLDEAVYCSPAKVRQVLSAGAPFATHGAPLPGTWEALNSEFASTTNWAGFAGDLAIAGAKQLLHLPMVPLSVVPFESTCVFRPWKGCLAVMALTKRFAKEDYLRDAPLGEPVSEAVFG